MVLVIELLSRFKYERAGQVIRVVICKVIGWLCGPLWLSEAVFEVRTLVDQIIREVGHLRLRKV